MGGGQSVEAGGSDKSKASRKALHIVVKEKDAVPGDSESVGEERLPSTLSMTTRSQFLYRRFFGTASPDGFARELGFQFDALKAHTKAFFQAIMALPERRDLLPQHEAALAKFRCAILEIRSQIDTPEKHVQKLLPHHLNQVIHITHLKNALPGACALLLDDYLRGGLIPSDFVEKITDMTHRGIKKLPQLSYKRKQFHHDVPHAVRLKLDVEREIKALDIWQNDTSEGGRRHPRRDEFLREVTLSIAMLHDYYQKSEKKPGSQAESAEEATAEQVFEWLLKALDIPLSDAEASPSQNKIKKLLKLMCYQQIVGGTTVLLGDFMAKLPPHEAVSSLDLMALEPIVERVLLGTGTVPSRARESNASLITEIDEVAKVLSKNDKTPGAALEHALSQVRNKKFATVPLLETYCGGMPVLRNFFEHYYTPYFSGDVLRHYYTPEDAAQFGSEESFFAAVNQQNFFTHFTPHWFMPLEFIPQESVAEARRIADFIALCRREYLVSEAPAAFNRAFDEAFERYDINGAIAPRFFREGSIAFEGKFINSQKKALERRAHELAAAGLSPDVVQRVVDPRVSAADKKNIEQLACFYHDMSAATIKKDMMKELMMATMFSEGQLMAYELGLDASQQVELEDDNAATNGPSCH